MKEKQFPVTPVEDWIIVRKIPVKTIQEKKGSALNLTLSGRVSAKNILDIERQKANDAATYELAEEELLKTHDEHPNQGVIVAVGEGRIINGLNTAMQVKVGDHIYLRGRTGEPIIVEGKLYWMHKLHEVFAVKNI